MTPKQADLIRRLAWAEARENFWAFRCMLHPDMKRGWRVKEVAAYLQRFYDQWAAGQHPRLTLTAPPQHGKSYTITDFLAWCAGRKPNASLVFTSYADSLGVRTNLALQRMMSD